MRNLKNLNTTTMIALSLLLSTGVSSLTNQSQGGFVSTVYAASLTKGTTVRVTVSSSLHLRSGASTTSKSIASLGNGTTLEVISSTESWAKVKVTSGTHSGKEGYVSLNYVDNGNWTQTVGKEIKEDVYKVVKTNGGKLNVRANASSNSGIIGTLTNGTKVKIYAETTGWYKVKVGDKYGWSSKNYLVEPTVSSDDSKNEGTVSNDYGAINITDKNVILNANNVNARTGPGLSYSSKTKYNKGTQVKVTHQKTADGHTWYRISDNGLWISKKYVDDVNTSGGNGFSNSGEKDNGGSSNPGQKDNGGSGSGESSSNNKEATVTEKTINIKLVPKTTNATAYSSVKDLKTTSFKLNKNYVYQATKQATRKYGGATSTYYYVKAINSDRSVWISTDCFTVSKANFKVGSKYQVKTPSYLYKEHTLNTQTTGKHQVAKNNVVKINSVKASSANISDHYNSVAKKGVARSGWVNMGVLYTTKSLSVHSDKIESVSISDMFKDVYALDKESQVIVSQSSADNDDYKKVTGVASKPYLTQLNVCLDESEPYYTEQYLVDITSEDETVTTLRFDPSDFNLLSTLLSDQSVTVYADPSTTNTDSTLPMFIVGYDVIEKNENGAIGVHTAPLSDVDVVNIMATDFSEFLASYGITVGEFSQDDIEAIVKEINKPKFNQNSVTIGGDEIEVNKSESSKSNKNDSSVLFGGMKSKF